MVRLGCLLVGLILLGGPVFSNEQREWVFNPFAQGEDSLVQFEAIPLSGKMVLQGVWEHDGRRRAMISGEIVAIGSQIGNYSIFEIGRDFVVLESSQGHKSRMELAEDD